MTPESNKALAQGGTSIPQETRSLQGPEARSRAKPLGCTCGSRTGHPQPQLCPRLTPAHAPHCPHPPSPLANCPPPHPSPHPLGIGCQASVPLGFGGREHQVPKWAQWEGRSHVLLLPLLMRPSCGLPTRHPQLLGLLAWQPSPRLPHPPPRLPHTVHQPRPAAGRPHTPTHALSRAGSPCRAGCRGTQSCLAVPPALPLLAR